METNTEVQKILNEIKNNFYNIIKSGEFIIRDEKIKTNLIIKSLYNKDFNLIHDNIDIIIDNLFEDYSYNINSCEFQIFCNNRINFYLDKDKEITHKHLFRKNTTEIIKVKNKYDIGRFELTYNNDVTKIIIKAWRGCTIEIISVDKFETVYSFHTSEVNPKFSNNICYNKDKKSKKNDDSIYFAAAASSVINF